MMFDKKQMIIGAVVLFVLYMVYSNMDTIQAMLFGLTKPILQGPPTKVIDLGMHDYNDPNAFGTTAECDRRWENQSVRKEFNVDPMPLAEGCTSCAKKGVPNPAAGDLHVCRCGPPSKRMVDAMGGNHMLPHVCAPCAEQYEEPAQLGRWWKRRGCADPASVGLDLRPTCSRC